MSSPLKQNTTTIQNLINTINSLPEASSGVELPTLTNEGSASDLIEGKELIDADGNKVTGTFTIDSELSTQDNLISQIQTALSGKAAATPTLQTKTVTPTAASQTATPDSGYDGLSKVTVNAMPTTTQATPSITINSSGLITATATQTAGYVAAGTTSGIKQLTTQSAKTVEPITSSQIAVASGHYATGAVTVAGDSNLVAANIKSGVSIFGVNGTYTGDVGNYEDACVTRTLTSYTNNRITTVGEYAFCDCLSLTTVNLPAVMTISSYAFQNCSMLTTVSLPAVTTINNYVFQSCYNLKSLYLMGSSVCTLATGNSWMPTYAFGSTPIGGYSESAGAYGSIYVPASLLTSYQTATNWTNFSSRFVGI